MRIVNLTDSNINVLGPLGNTVNIPAKGETENIVASPTLIKTIINIYTPLEVRFKFAGQEAGNAQDAIAVNIMPWIAED